MKKSISLLLTLAILIGLMAPGLSVLADDGNDVTAKVTQSMPDVLVGDKYLIKDGALQPGVNQPGGRGVAVHIHYNWDIPDTTGMKAGDFFTIDLPNMKDMLKEFSFNAGTPIDIKTATDEILGTFTVDMQTGKLKAVLNDLAVSKKSIDKGFFKLEFRSLKALNIVPGQPGSGDANKILITEGKESVNQLGVGKFSDNLTVNKGGASEKFGNQLRLYWTIKVNYDQMAGFLENGQLEDRNNVWVEDVMSDPTMRVVETDLRIYAPFYAATAEGKLSSSLIYTPHFKPSAVITSNAGETLQEFKTRAEGMAKEPFTVFIFKGQDDATADAILLYAGNLANGGMVAYNSKFPTIEKDFAKSLQERVDKGQLTAEQAEYTKALYGMDDDSNTDMKFMPGFYFYFTSLPAKNGVYVNTGKMSWDGSKVYEDDASAKFAQATGGAGYTDTTAVIVEKVWKDGPVGGPVTVELLQDGTVIRTVKLGVTNPQGADETSDWKFTFSGLLAKKEVNGQPVDIVYSIKEVNVGPQYTSKVLPKNSDNKIVVENTYKPGVVPPVPTVTPKVTKKWIGDAAGAVKVGLFKKGEATPLQTVTLSGAALEATFDPVPASEAGVAIEYEVKEVDKPQNSEEVSNTEVAKNEFVITNRNTSTMRIPVSKKWAGQEGDKAVVRLMQREVKTVSGQVETTEKEVAVLELNSGNAWKGAFENQPVFSADGNRYIYVVTEDKIANYTTKVEMVTPNDITQGVVVTNTYDVPTPNEVLTPYVPNTDQPTPPRQDEPSKPSDESDDKEKPSTPDKPTTPNETLTDDRTPQGDPNVVAPAPLPTPDTVLTDNTIPQGKKELPKTNGFPVSGLFFLGVAVAGVGVFTRKK